MTVELKSVGVSLISQRPPEELVFIHLSEIRIATMFTSTAEMIEASIQDIQVDSQLFEAQCSVMMYVTPNTWSTDPEEAAIPALYLSAERTLTNHSYNAIIFKYLLLRVKNMSFTVDERPILELFAFAGWEAKDDNENTGENDFETQRILAEASSVHAQRFYFGCLQLIFPQLRLSVLTSSKLSERLTRIKRMLGVVLVKFEGAAVELEPFCRNHSFENSQFLINAIIKHYKNELKSQGAVILGSVDFLGNPLGLINDFSEGVTGLLYEGNVGALVKNVTHGISNSAAKFTESLGDSLGRVILDDAHEEMRQRIKSRTTGKTGDHIVAGLKGFSIGILGGFTSVFRQTYDGAASDGLQGFISGLGRGLVGTVTKPVVGMLDLATETASAVRDSSRRYSMTFKYLYITFGTNYNS
ncbi:hypothetical protein AAG570_012324 [Ranatra chinensis]|uniref:Vacuolar protein sorting-associated protein 13 DH-like domain-containing protein n=1 Tax=Ranatra chinensis TaxID=642074 RepID=A0ABD0YIL7_9HEMI